VEYLMKAERKKGKKLRMDEARKKKDPHRSSKLLLLLL